MAETKEVITNRSKVAERIGKRYPEESFEDDEALYGRIYDDYDDYDKKLGEYEKHEKAFADLFSTDPRSAHFLSEWRKGGDPAVALVRMFGTDVKDAIDDPARQEEMAAANKEFVERVAKEKELEDVYQKNLAESLEAIDAMQKERGLSDEQIDEAMTVLIEIVKDAVVGKFTAESIGLALKAKGFDAAVAAADHEGEVRGRNAKIEEKYRERSRGDGGAVLNGSNNVSKPVKSRPSLGALDKFAEGDDIWSRGGEKRKKY